MSTSSSGTTPQQINVADLQLPQLAEVKRQLEEVNLFAGWLQGLTKICRSSRT
jgi:hypothetical protein